jgi:hypothetical protein
LSSGFLETSYSLLSACGSDWIEGDPAARRCQEVPAAWWHRAPQALSRELDQELANAAAHVCELWRSGASPRL